MKPGAFDLHAPTSVDEAVALLGELGDDAKVLAGGQSLVPMLSLRLASFGHLVDVGRIAELRSVGFDDGTVTVGATTLDAVVEHDPELASTLPLLARATPLIGHFQIRNRGTVGGSIAHADPAAEYPAVALALGAEMEVASVRGVRTITADRFFEGYWTTAMDADELLVAARFPTWEGRCGFAVREFARRFGDFAIAGAVVAVRLGADDRIDHCAVGLLGLGPTPLRATTVEKAVVGQGTEVATDELGRLAVADLTDVPSDLHGSASYRRRVGAAMVSRALSDAIREAIDA
ncbi:MAG TPA: FAD binding domain-containing protein [Acidimicrobiales bacterium]|nr:FAD binding domain-containing protein [Acidimicrobiales bacterium]